MNKMIETTQINSHKFEIDEDCGFQYVEDIRMYGDDKPQNILSHLIFTENFV